MTLQQDTSTNSQYQATRLCATSAHVLLFTGVLLVARTLAIWSAYFYEEDEVSLAVGASGLVLDNMMDLYRYTPQLGYYRLLELLGLMFGGNVSFIPAIMKGLSALAGVLIPALGLLAFRGELSVRERWFVALGLAMNPILWKSSQYGNSAMAASAFVTAGLVILSNRHSPAGRIAALAFVGIATLVRADSVLLIPVAAFLIYRQDGWRGSLKWSAAFSAVMALVYGAIFAVDPRLDSAVGAVVRHMTVVRPTEFWEYLLWAMSPIPLIFAAAGMSSLLDSRPGLLVALFVWFTPTMGFYLSATTTTRYFVNCALPLSAAAAVGICRVARRLEDWMPSRLAWAVIVGFASLHLVVPLGHFTLREPFQQASIMTDDRQMPTGALLAATYLSQNVLARSLPRPAFTGTGETWQPQAFTSAANRLADPNEPKRTVVILLRGGWWHAFHYHSQVAGARYVPREPGDPSLPYATVTWLELGNARVMTVPLTSESYRELPRFDVTAGDEIWVMGENPFPDEIALPKIPAGVSLFEASTFDPHFRVFRVTAS